MSETTSEVGQAAQELRVLVTWGSKLGGTEGIAQMIGESLAAEGYRVVMRPAAVAPHPDGFDAVIVGGGLYANRWQAEARRYVAGHAAALRRIPVWLFSSGPLDDSAEQREIPPPTQVAVLMERIGALGHATFGGRLAADAKGFPAAAMAKDHAGDWRNPERIRGWASEIGRAIPSARPGRAIDHPGRSPLRLAAYGVVGWAAHAAILLGLSAAVSRAAAFVLGAIATPLLFAALAYAYFRVRGARESRPVALAWSAIVLLLDAVVVGPLIQGSASAMLASLAGLWLPLLLIFLVTWMVGFVVSTLPWPELPSKPKPGGEASGAARDAHAA